MCLRIVHRNLKTVPVHKEGKPSRDKVVFKIFLVNKNGCYFSPFTGFKWTVGEETTDIEEPIIKTVKPARGLSYRLVSKGFFHAFTSSSAAVKAANELVEKFSGFLSKTRTSIVVCKTIIPEGTKYYEGTYMSICAKTLKILEDVPIFKSENTSGG